MDRLLLNAHTKQQLEQFVRQPAQVLMLLAPEGSGKLTVAEALARQLLQLSPTKPIQDNPEVIFIAPVSKSISIEIIRNLQKTLQLKTVGKRSIQRVVIVQDAHRLTIEAQNALLKMLEEPPADTVYILTALSTNSVLPTILSRSQYIELKPPSLAAVMHYFKEKDFSSDRIETALRHSGNRLGLASALLDNKESHPLVDAVREARAVLAGSLAERLGRIDSWIKEKGTLLDRLDTLGRICQTALTHAANQNDHKNLRRWKRYSHAVYNAKASLEHNPNLKLLLTDLFLRLG